MEDIIFGVFPFEVRSRGDYAVDGLSCIHNLESSNQDPHRRLLAKLPIDLQSS